MTGLCVDTGVRVPTRDGVSLATTVFRPRGHGSWPAILMRTPYGRTSFASVSLQVHALALSDAGYAVVLQDVRGRGDSEGAFSPFVNEQSDGVDTVEWLVDQQWCDGSIGLAGISYNAFNQLAITTTNHDAVKCWVPGLAPADVRTSWIRRGGLLDLGFHLSWGLGGIAALDDRTARPDAVLAAYDDPTATARRGWLDQPELRSTPAGSWFFDWVESIDPYPEDSSVPSLEQLATVSAPALVVAGWFDVFSSGSVELLDALRSGPSPDLHRLVAGPWDHSGLPLGRSAGDRDFGRSAIMDLHLLQLQWFDQHLRGGDEMSSDRIFVTGRNTWHESASWPPMVDQLGLELGKDRSLSPRGGSTGVIEVEVSAEDPTPLVGGAVFPWEPALRPGAFDQRGREERDDVVAFAGSPLKTPLLVAGCPRLSIPIRASTADPVVHATLVEIEPNGLVWNVADGMARADSTSGVAEVRLGPIAHEFGQGSTVGLDIAFGADVRLGPVDSGSRLIDLAAGAAILTLPIAPEIA